MRKIFNFITSLLAVSFIATGCNSPKEVFECKVNELEELQELQDEKTKTFFSDDNYEEIANSMHTAEEHSLPNPVKLSREKVEGIETYYVKISEMENFDDYLEIEVNDNHFDFYNSKINTKYYYSIGKAGKNNSEIIYSNVHTFTTSNSIVRNLNVGGVTNFRDLGGLPGIKQGLIYRSAAFNNFKVGNVTYNVTDEGSFTIRYQLGIKTEIDIRRTDETAAISESVIGNDVLYLPVPMYYSGQNILTYTGSSGGVTYDNPKQIKVIFNYLSDDGMYPIDIHCVRGTDRTGCIAFLIEGLLGVEEDLLYRDYLYSNFGRIDSNVKLSNIYDTMSTENKGKYVNVLKNYEGTTLQNKIYNYLNREIGVTQENLNKVINILSE